MAGNRIGLVAPSIPDTYRSDDNSSYFTLSIGTNESMCPCNYLPDYDVPPPPLPVRGLPPSAPNSFKSESGHSFLEVTTLANEDSQSYYQRPLPQNPVSHNDIATTSPSNGNRTLWVPPTVSLNQQLGLRCSKTFGSHHHRAGVHRSNSFKNRSWQQQHHRNHRKISKSGSTGGYYSSRHYRYALDQPKMTLYGQRQGLPPIPSHGCHQQHQYSFPNSSDTNPGRTSVPESKSSTVCSHPMVLTDTNRSQAFGSESRAVDSQSGRSMNTEDITEPSPYLEPPKIITDEDNPSNPRYDEVPLKVPAESAYDDLTPTQRRTGYELYDVPRKADN